MLIAGSDTTAAAIEWTIAELILHPQCMKKLQGELDTVVGTDRVVSETDLSNLPYLQAVVKESFRLHPPGPLGIPHMALQPTKVWGYDLPANTQLLVNSYTIQRDPKHWANPLEFRPERFIENPQIDLKGSHFQLLPFGAGRRMCPGMSLGILVAQISVARLAQGFNFALPHGEDPRNLDMTERFGTIMARVKPLLVIPKPRLPSNLY
jgi:flavonoid 3'-monooxygenase